MSETFGQALRRHRLAAGMPLREVAEHLGCSVVYVADVERGRRGPFRWEWVVKCEGLLGLAPGTLTSVADRRKRVEVGAEDRAELAALLAPSKRLQLLLYRLMAGSEAASRKK